MTEHDTRDVARWRLTVTGTVQGVGFRPHVHRLAVALGVSGFVGNDAAGVFIEAQADPATLEEFRQAITDQAPPLARIVTVDTMPMPAHPPPVQPEDAPDFAIVPSRSTVGPVTSAPPDTVACEDCLAELRDPDDRRFGHPFITCTNCGPRFTIITALPYDRPATTMASFRLCDACDREYRDPADRRHHAQPVACADCGPTLRLHPAAAGDADSEPDVGQTRDPAADGIAPHGSSAATLHATRLLLQGGAIVAIKGVGGYHLACRADDEEVVAELRRRKHRPGKPLAVMVPSLEVADLLAEVTDDEARLLSSAEGPIVLLRRRSGAGGVGRGETGRIAGGAGLLAEGVAPGNPLIGIMLPASPLHHLLFDEPTAPRVLVMTSANLTEEPICTDDDETRVRMAGIADAFLSHDRQIAVPCDDSVARVDPGGAVTLIRRSRGFVPTPLALPFEGAAVLAVGGQLKNTAALTDGRRVWLSQHIGDMGSLPTLQAFERTVQRFSTMHDVAARRIAVDAHPDYTTRRWALERHPPEAIVEVQHHHAHIAAVMAEHGLAADARVIGVAFDGTGYGPDGTIWGGEVLVAGYDGFTRAAHLSPVLLPGGDAAIRHPRRVALSHLRSAGLGWDEDLPPVRATSAEELRVLDIQLDRGVNCVPTSSMGRLFDAVASLLGVCHDVTFEAQAAIQLEIAALLAEESGAAPVPIRLPLVRPEDPGLPITLDAGACIRDVATARTAGVLVGAIALGVHHAIASAVAEVAEVADRIVRSNPSAGGVHDRTRPPVALSGGVFTNALLTRLCVERLVPAGFEVLRHRMVPPNDGGLALGQAVIASLR